MTRLEQKDYVAHRLMKAEAMLREARVQEENDLWGLALNRYYFAVFHAISALLPRLAKRCER